MSLFDFFFPEQAQATHLRNLADQQRHSQIRAARNLDQSDFRTTELEKRVLDLEQDLGFVTLVLGGILESLDDKGQITREDLKAKLEELDGMDGIRDGKLDINILRGRTQ